jgi:hypothetical protein|tara:strand:- start:1708 stop:1896 length:189 start_codon:yes stop_codon:yes gene_type:complete
MKNGRIKVHTKMGGGLMGATKKLKAEGKMGGGQMNKPMMAKTGKLVGGQKNLPKHLQKAILA